MQFVLHIIDCAVIILSGIFGFLATLSKDSQFAIKK